MDILVTVTPFGKIPRPDLEAKIKEEIKKATPIGEKGDPFFDWLCSLSKDASDLVDKATLVPKERKLNCKCPSCLESVKQELAFGLEEAKTFAEWCNRPENSKLKLAKGFMLEETGAFAQKSWDALKPVIEEHSMICKCPECKAADREARRIANKLIPLLEREVLAKNSVWAGADKHREEQAHPDRVRDARYKHEYMGEFKEPTSGFGFEVALNYLKAGRKVRRKGQKYLTLLSRTDGPKRLLVEGYDRPTDSVNIKSAMAQDWELVMPLELNKLETMKKVDKKKGASFGEVLVALQQGLSARRDCWNPSKWINAMDLLHSEYRGDTLIAEDWEISETIK